MYFTLPLSIIALILRIDVIHTRHDHDNPYCKKTCRDLNGNVLQHTLCSAAPCTPSSSCGTLHYLHPKKSPEGDELRQAILDVHNNVRWQLTIGSFNETLGLPANMNVLRYNLELEFMAKCHANRCEGYGKYDQCRKTSMYEETGQNNFNRYFPAYKKVNKTAFEKRPFISAMIAMELWESEMSHLKLDVVLHPEHYQHLSSSVKNILNMIYANVTFIGCALTRKGIGDRFNLIMYCNYAPVPLVIKGPLYRIGPPCSRCADKEMKCNNEKYFGMCGPSIPVTKEDHFEEPFSLE